MSRAIRWLAASAHVLALVRGPGEVGVHMSLSPLPLSFPLLPSRTAPRAASMPADIGLGSGVDEEEGRCCCRPDSAGVSCRGAPGPALSAPLPPLSGRGVEVMAGGWLSRSCCREAPAESQPPPRDRGGVLGGSFDVLRLPWTPLCRDRLAASNAALVVLPKPGAESRQRFRRPATSCHCSSLGVVVA